MADRRYAGGRWLACAATIIGLVLVATLSGPAAQARTDRPAAGVPHADGQHRHGQHKHRRTTRPSFGVAAPGLPGDLRSMRVLARRLDRRPNVLMWYAAWSWAKDFPRAEATRVARWGAVPEITWEPWDPAAGVDQPRYALRRIARGSFDRYLTRWATQIRAYRRPVVLRFAHEMNGSWYPWAEAVNGNRPGDYVAAWRHVRRVFARVGADNVRWVWSPNVPYPGSTPLSRLYPGDRHVDRVALDGYNWAGHRPGTTWQRFWEIFRSGFRKVRALSDRPMYVGEVAAPERGGDKAAWTRDMFAALARHREIRGILWFDFAKEADWRIDSSAASLRAFRTGLRRWR